MRRIFQGRAARIHTWAGIIFVVSLGYSVMAQQSLAFAWDPNPEPDVAGYRIYYGVASGVYTNVVDTGNTTNATIGNLIGGTTYYFALTAYNTVGLESPRSGEISYAVPLLARLQVRITPARHAVLTVTGPAGRTYNIQASTDLRTWGTIGSVTVGTGGSVAFTDAGAASQPKRFYRTLQP